MTSRIGKSSRISCKKWLTDIGGRAGRARLYWAVDEASVPVARMSVTGALSLAALPCRC